MEARYEVRFGPFRLDPAQGRLWRGTESIVRRPRALAVLQYLAVHPGRLVPKAELVQQVWGGVHVTNTMLRVCIRAIRATLGDAAAAPQYLETVGQEGYRFIGDGDECPPTAATPGPIVGRQRELAALQRLYAQAAGSDRQLVLLSGEAGIGKTTVVELWLAQLAEWGAVMGQEFAVAAVAAAVQRPVNAVEAVCERLATQGELVAEDGLVCWPDGTVSGGYRFRHALYREILYERIGEMRRLWLHARLAARLEAHYGVKQGEFAAQLAVHFERGGELLRAIHHWQQAGDTARRQFAYGDAVAAVSQALALLETVPASVERTRQELTLQCMLGELLLLTRGHRETEAPFTRAYELCQRVEETPLLPRVLWGLIQMHTAQVQLDTAGALCQELFHLAEHEHDPTLLQRAYLAFGRVELFSGNAAVARVHLEQSLSFGETPLGFIPPPGEYRLGVLRLASFARVLWQPEVGLEVLGEAVSLLDTTEECWWEAEVYRLQAILRLQLPHPEVSEAEAWLQRALDVSRSQQAKILELRAAMTLSRLWQSQRQSAKARQLLAPIYNWFTEGFDTDDLRWAKAVLDQLS